jgi:cytochrome c biogenesis protein CcdA
MLSLPLAFLAGLLSILSPCVLPLLPIVLGAAASEGRHGPFALAAGVAISFVTVGLFVALFGWGIGLDAGFFRVLAAVLLIVVGVTLVVPLLQTRLAVAAGPMSGWIDAQFGESVRGGHWGQFGMGVLLGAVWSPCVGPTLGAASLLAARGENVGQVALTMIAFGFGAALPLGLLGLLSREMLSRWRSRMLTAGSSIKTGLGIVLIAAGLLIVAGQDKRLEAYLVERSPAWLTELTTRF